MAAPEHLRIELVFCPAPREVIVRQLVLPVGSRVADALQAAGWPQAVAAPASGAPGTPPMVSIWGRKQPLDHTLRDGDRVELLRALRVDPKVARRERFNQQGARSTGLFARRRPGAKSGY